MGMGIDEARQDNHSGCINSLGFGYLRRRARCNLCNAPVFHEDIAFVEDTPAGIHRDDCPVFDQQGSGHRSPPVRIAYIYYAVCAQILILVS